MGGRKDPGKAPWELYNLSKDLSEESNLAKTNPERLAELVALWEKMNGEMREPLFRIGIFGAAVCFLEWRIEAPRKSVRTRTARR
jgi:hypothetical protein